MFRKHLDHVVTITKILIKSLLQFVWGKIGGYKDTPQRFLILTRAAISVAKQSISTQSCHHISQYEFLGVVSWKQAVAPTTSLYCSMFSYYIETINIHSLVRSVWVYFRFVNDLPITNLIHTVRIQHRVRIFFRRC